MNFQLPDVPDPRVLAFKYRSTSTQTVWEPDDYNRHIVHRDAAEIWTFAYSPRILYQDPFPQGVSYRAGDVLAFHVLTAKRFRGGHIYAWNPYTPGSPSASFVETARDDTAAISSFAVTLLDWMTAGFHLKLVGADVSWEPEASNRLWRPCDGASLWLKSGECDVRSTPLALIAVALEVLVPASISPAPTLTLTEVTEAQTFDVLPTATHPYEASASFQVATYRPTIYPQAPYNIRVKDNQGENPAIVRPFPANSTNVTETSRFALGASAWKTGFPQVTSTTTLIIEPRALSSFDGGLSVQLAVGNASPYATVTATRTVQGTWTASLPLAEGTTTCIRLVPAAGTEPKPYDWIDTGRYFTPSGAPTIFTTEGVYGLCARGPTTFAEPPSRAALMEAAFGAAVASSGVFAAVEMPQGSTISSQRVFFVVHAPHAIWAALILIDEAAPGAPARREIPMTLTPDTRYWWCDVSLAEAPPGARYHFVLNDDLEVLDPACRDVQDRGSFQVSFGSDPSDPTTAWSLVLDVAAVMATARAQPWQTMGWQNLLIYEVHARRFTDTNQGALASFDLLADELNPVSRLGQPGYLRGLPVTAFELLPVQEFNSAISWGYDPSFYFAVEGRYGGSSGLARFVNAAHGAGRAVMLDVVYNHSLGSPLMAIAPDVYTNGDYDGNRMNCGHPMVLEHLRQATLYLWRTFGLDGFRFDDTNTIATQCPGGWEFLAAIRSSLRTAATAEGKGWPYCVAENPATQAWDISDPGFGVMDGQWGITEAYCIRGATYDTKNGGDDAGTVSQAMNDPSYWGRPFFQVTRFGESHDMVSAQDAQNQRIAARPPFRQGLQMAKALGTLTLLSNGVPMLFMGQEVGETLPFSFDSSAPALNPQRYDLPAGAATDNTRVLAWFRQLIGLRNDPVQGLQGNSNYQIVGIGHRTVAFTCGTGQCLFAVVTFGTANQQQDSSWLGLPAGPLYKEIFNTSWPVFQVEFETEQTNGGYAARIASGQVLSLPFIGAFVLQRL